MKFFVVVSVLFCCALYCQADIKVSHYRNDEKHIAKELDVNNVPIDPACKFRTVWENVRLNGVTRSDVPNSLLEHITIIKFHYAGAWIAWTDKDGYHEPSKEHYVPWTHFPDEIRNYYAAYYFKEWDGLKTKRSFFLRTAQLDPKAKKYKNRRGSHILRRASSGVLCRALLNNVYIPYSELPLDVRTQCGFYENESYIPAMPVLEKKISSLNDKILFVESNNVRVLRRFKEGSLVRITIKINGRNSFYNIFINKFKGNLEPNHKSDLHVFKEAIFEKICVKCKLSDHLTEKFFNFMFDRQSRTPCPIMTHEYAFIKKGTQKVGRITVNSYQYLPDYDQKFPKDSVRLLGNKNIPKREE